MRHPGLLVRMLIAGSILFAFYLLVIAAGVAYLELSLEVAVLLTLGFVGFQWKFGKWMALRSVRARDVEPAEHPQIHQATERLSRDMKLPMPRLMIAEMGVPNAFAIGRRKKGTVVLSTELIRTLDQQELEGVIAHELAHIRNRDVVMMVLGQSIASLVGILVYFAMMSGRRNLGSFILAYLGAIAAQMLVMVFVLAISRYREYVADADAARTLGSGDPLARALEKIQRGNERAEDHFVDDNVAALMIFDVEHGLLRSVFSTHPPAERRIERLRTGTF